MGKILTADFSSGCNQLRILGLYQYDHGVELHIIGIDLSEVNRIDFASETSLKAVPVVVTPDKDGTFTVTIPATVTKTAYDAAAYIYVASKEYGYTIKSVIMPVQSRPEAGDGSDADDGKENPFDDMVEKVTNAAKSAAESEKTVQEISDQIKGKTEQIDKNAEEIKNLGKTVEKLKENISSYLGPEDVQNAVDVYLESNTIEGFFTPNNIVLVEETEEESAITTETIIGEVLEKLELRAVDENRLGLYLGDKLIDSIVLEEFKSNEIICTGLALDPTELSFYGKKTVELIATASPIDCTQKVRWFTDDESLATVTAGTVNVTGRKGTVTIMAVCGNYKAACVITIQDYVYGALNWEIGQIQEIIGAEHKKTADTQKMRIASDYLSTPLDTEIVLVAGSGYFYQLYKYAEGKLVQADSWVACTGTIKISSEEYSGVALKIRKSNYGTWTDDDITAFAKTVTVRSV